jgi:hypothetical protein
MLSLRVLDRTVAAMPGKAHNCVVVDFESWHGSASCWIVSK